MPAPRYIADLDGAERVDLEGLTLLFHPRSGMTHILAPPAPQILSTLAEGPAGLDLILRRLARLYAIDDAAAAAAVTARLTELEACGLVARA